MSSYIDSAPYGRQAVYYTSKAALPTLTALIFLLSASELFVQFLQWFLPLFGHLLYRAHIALEASQYVDPVWRDSAPVLLPAEPWEWPDVKGIVGGWWRTAVGWLQGLLGKMEGALERVGGGAPAPRAARAVYSPPRRAAPVRSMTTPTPAKPPSAPPRPARRFASSSSSSKASGPVKAGSVGSLGYARSTANPFAAERGGKAPSHDHWNDDDERGSVWSGESWERA